MNSTHRRSTALSDKSLSIVARMRKRTHALHAHAEQSGYISEIFHGRGSASGYTLFLRNLLQAYQELERGLERHRDSPIFAAVPWRDLYRVPAMERDLLALAGPDWERSVVLLPSAMNYSKCVASAASDDGERLIAHAYVRYMGDLSGGQVLKRLLNSSLGLGPAALSFYEFPRIADAASFKADLRAAIDAAAHTIVDAQAVVDEAAMAFQLNIALSEEIHSAVQATACNIALAGGAEKAP